MASSSELVVVICHGSYHTKAPYEPMMEVFMAEAGIPSFCPQLPTADLTKLNVGDPDKPDFNLGPPAEDVLKPLIIDQKKEVLLIAHSSGGWVATEVARPDLQATTRKKQGLAGGVIGIFYIGAFIIPVGESVHTFFQPKDGSFVVPPFLEFHNHGGAGLGTVKEAETFFFNDLSPDEAMKWAGTLTASPVLTTKLQNDAYAALPCAYLITEGDLALPKAYQEGMIANQAQKTGDFTIYRCPAGHSPHLSRTKETVVQIQHFIKKIKA
ncbi:alpha/beta-hydrolase [Xylariaceae sp. FL1272]|nr:alpha/beta-hydrolase [Xylariaceae sp. FL1272]